MAPIFVVLTKDPSLIRVERRAIAVSFWLSFAMLVLKWIAYVMTGSVTMFSDALESVVHVLAVGFAAYSLSLSYTPADDNHHFGHDKVAFLASGIEGALVVFAGIAILYSSATQWFTGVELKHVYEGLSFTFVAAVLNGLLALHLKKVGKNHGSLILSSNATHIFSDVLTSIGAMIGVLLAYWTKAWWIDPLVAIGFGFLVIHSGVKVLRSAALGLTDATNPKDEAIARKALNEFCHKNNISFHRFRMRESANQLFVDFHLHFDSNITLKDAHQIGTAAERVVAQALGRPADIMSHIETHDDQDEEQGLFIPNHKPKS